MWNHWSLLKHIICWNKNAKRKPEKCFLEFGSPNRYTGLPNGLNTSLVLKNFKVLRTSPRRGLEDVFWKTPRQCLKKGCHDLHFRSVWDVFGTKIRVFLRCFCEVFVLAGDILHLRIYLFGWYYFTGVNLFCWVFNLVRFSF